MKSITIIGPCYNEEDNLDEYLERITKVVGKLDLEYKIILVDDGSKDKTWQKILENSKKNKKIYGIKFTKNFGHQSAIMAGINSADSDYVFFSDVDLQDPPELLEKMYYEILSKKINIVFGKRLNNNENFFKKYTSILFYKFFNLLSDTKIHEQTSDFLLMDKKVLKELKKVKEKDIFLRGLIPWFGFNSSYL